MDAQGLNRVEHLCAIVYGGAQCSDVERVEAHKTLLTLQTSAHFMPQCRYLLDNAKSDFTMLFASRSLLQIVTRDWKNISTDQRLELVRVIMQKLAKIRDGDINQATSYITRSLIQVVSRITKLGWAGNEKHRAIFNDVVQFLQAGGPHAVLGLRVLSELVNEFDQGLTNSEAGRMNSQDRLAAQAFREQGGLTRAFKLALESVQRYHQNNERLLLKEALHTLHSCLSYDFVGNGQDDSDDVVSCLYIPLDWAEHVARAPAIHLFFDIYKRQWQVANESELDTSENSAASMCLQCIVLLVAVRRSVFDPDSRLDFLVALLEGTTSLMREKHGLSHSEACLHNLCRVLARIKNHFQLIDLSRPPQYRPWLEEFAKFTESVLGAWRSISTRSVHYLMRLWASLVLPTPYLQVRDGYRISASARDGSSPAAAAKPNDKAPTYLTGLVVFVPGVVRAFVSTRADLCASAALAALDIDSGRTEGGGDTGVGAFGAGIGGIEDDLLDDEGMLLEQLAPLSVLTRFRYGESAEGIATLFNDALNKRQQALLALTNAQLSGGSTDAINSAKIALTDSQARLAFLTYLIGAIVGGHVSRVSASVIERLDELNSELAALVFRMVIATQNAEDQIANQGQSSLALNFGFRTDAAWKLELAALYFFRCFQNLYIESRARDDADKSQRQKRTLGLVEDVNGFINLAWTTPPELDTNNRSSLSMPIFKIHSLPTALPSMDAITSGGSVGITASTQPKQRDNDSEMEETSSSRPATGSTEANKQNTEETTNRASNVQRGIAARLGVSGGDRTLLDIAMRRIFGLLQHAQHNQDDSGSTGASAPVVLVQRALNVLYQLSVGVSVVHAGRAYTPRLMSSGRLLLESEVIQDLLNNPDTERFTLLTDPKHGRARSFLMATLSKLLFTKIKYPSPNPMSSSLRQSQAALVMSKDDRGSSDVTRSEDPDASFVQFVEPLTNRADMLLNLVQQNPPTALLQYKEMLIGLFRDLRGIITSASVNREYELVFAWLTPNRIRLLTLVAEVWFDNTDVMIPLLKLLSEIVFNRGSRIDFPPLSVGGLILFKEASRVLVAYCNAQFQKMNLIREKQKQDIQQQISQSMNNETTIRDLSMITGVNSKEQGSDPLSMVALRDAVMAMGEELSDQNSPDVKKGGVVELAPGAVGPGITVDMDTKSLKCARICVVTMNRMLGGRYAQLGTFELYQDRALLDARRVILELALLGSPTHVMSFPKMARGLVVLLNVLAEKFVMSIISLPSPLFARTMACLAEAAASSYTHLSTPASAAIEYIAIFRCKTAAHAATTVARRAPVLNPEHRSRGSRIKPQDLVDAASYFAAHNNAQPNLFGELLTLLLDRLLTNSGEGNESSNQWTLARPIVPLILTAPEAFEKFRTRFLGSQSAGREPMVREGFDALFSRLTPAITVNGQTSPNPQHFEEMLAVNDRFTKAICSYYRELKR